ncbi:hypothetical protein [Aquisalimonas sp.]|uniref:hypothetical protein n=1 Tax=Aquisalimonas sp. TaxID=1872621 RepID=UPI0025B8A3C5|nr:hypothetical protein [Aquisalimonas sp.]
MTGTHSKLGLDVLSDYVAGELDEQARQEVERQLAQSPEDQARVRAYQLQSDALYRAYEPVLDEPIPDRLLAVLTPTERADVKPLRSSRSRSRVIFSGAMAASLALAVGGLAGWLVRGHLIEQEAQELAMAIFLDEAFSSYSLYAADDSPWRNAGAQDDPSAFGQWFQEEWELEVAVPDLSEAGYTFVGGRALPESRGSTGQVVYEDADGNMIALYFQYAQDDAPIRVARGGREGSLFEYEDDVFAYYWAAASGQANYAVLGRLGSDDLTALGEKLVGQVD